MSNNGNKTKLFFFFHVFAGLSKLVIFQSSPILCVVFLLQNKKKKNVVIMCSKK